MNCSHFSVVVVAAGSSSRMGFDKLFAPLCGKPVVWHSLRAFSECPETSQIVLVCRPDRMEMMEALAQEFPKCSKTVPGGEQRIRSVLLGLEALGPEDGFVAIHDAARPLIQPEAISRCFREAVEHGAATCGEKVADTLHRTDEMGFARETVSRDLLWRVQTPQIFRISKVREAALKALAEGVETTDEAGAFIRLGDPVRMVDTPGWNFKITVPADLQLAEKILADSSINHDS